MLKSKEKRNLIRVIRGTLDLDSIHVFDKSTILKQEKLTTNIN